MQNEKIKLQNVRLSYPSLFKTEMFAGGDTGKYAATFIMDADEHKKVLAEINKQISEMTKEQFKGKTLPADKIALKDGDLSGADSLSGKFTIKAMTKKRPLLIDADKTPIIETDNRLYAGCYVNAIISLWAQDNQWGKRINASLEGVQFRKDGEPFSSGGSTVDDFDFEAAEDDIAF